MTARRVTMVVVVVVVVLLAAACGGDGGGPSSAPYTAEVDPTSSTLSSTTTTPPPTSEPRPAPHVFPLVPGDACSYTDGHHDYPASDIFCPVGTTFVAVIDGVVDFVSREDRWDPAVDDPALRGGRSVAVIGDDGVRYYGSHLSSVADGIEPGVRVRAGQALGATGDSGNAAGTDPHLHFGLSHPTTPDDWVVRRGEVNPFPYLEAWRRGEDVTPVVP